MNHIGPKTGSETGASLDAIDFRSSGNAASKGHSRPLGFGLTVGIALLFAFGGYGHYLRAARAEATRAEAKALLPLIRTTQVAVSKGATIVELPASTEAFEVSSIYPRASGYVTQRLVDIGSRVKKGDLLAVIESPELDRQLAQAQAQYAQAMAALELGQSNAHLAEITTGRYAILAAKKYATQQEADNYRLALESRKADVRMAEANVAAKKADLQRLRQIAKYQRVLAPFDGVITSRNVDIGDLSNADSGNLIASGSFLFKEASDNTMRVRFDVPQSAAIGITDGLKADVSVPEMPDRVFAGKIARNADALASGTRTLLVEVDVDNRDHALKAGLYVTVRIEVPRTTPMISVPSEAVIFGDHGLQVATVVDGKIKLRHIQIDQDHGATVDVINGLQNGESVVLNPFAGIGDGQAVLIDDGEAKASIAKEG